MPTLAGKEVGPIGLGLMGLAMPAKFRKDGRVMPDEEVFVVLKEALARGANFWNGAEFYGTPDHNSLTLLNRYFDKYPEDIDKVVLSIKGCLDYNTHKPTGDAKSVRASVENCIRMLGDKKKIDVFEPARIDKEVSVEETFGELQNLVDEGKIGGVSISEASTESLRRAAKITKLEFLETEVNMFTDQVWSTGVAQACAELNIPILAYSPLGKGFLTGAIKTPDDLTPMQKMWPRFQGENFNKNLELVEKVRQAAEKQNVTSAQFAIAWVARRGKKPGQPFFIPLPGASSKERVAENFTVADIADEHFDEIDKFVNSFTTAGTRYPEHEMASLHN